MMNRMLLMFVIFLALTGCLQMEHTTKLYPDGSGKFIIKAAFKKDIFLNGAKMGVQPFDDIEHPDPEDIERNCKGIVAWSDIQREEDKEWIRFTVTGYFDDINKVKVYGKDEKTGNSTLNESFALQRKENGYVLLFEGRPRENLKKLQPTDMAKGTMSEEMKASMLEITKYMLKNLRIVIVMTMPGTITHASGWPIVEGRTAKIVFEGKDLTETTLKKADSQSESTPEDMKIECAKSEVSDSEMDAFKKESSTAKEGWISLREEWTKKGSLFGSLPKNANKGIYNRIIDTTAILSAGEQIELEKTLNLLSKVKNIEPTHKQSTALFYKVLQALYLK
jgi:hypothetical protein